MKTFFDNMGVVRFVFTTFCLFITFIIFAQSGIAFHDSSRFFELYIVVLLFACYFLVCANSFFKRGFVTSSVIIIAVSSLVWLLTHYRLTWHGSTIYWEEDSVRLIFIPLSIYIGIYIMSISEIIKEKNNLSNK